MARGVSSKRYAQAVFQIALDGNELEKWQSDLEALGAKLGDRQLSSLFENPKVPFREKQRILRTVLAGVGPLAMNLAYLLVAKNRLGILGDLIAEYGHLVDAHRGRAHAKVTTAVSLEERGRGVLEERLAKMMQKEMVITTSVDPEIIGGVVVRIGDQLIDGSIRTRLQELRRGLMESGVSLR